MKKLVALLIVSLMATAAFAVHDDGTDSFGIYFNATNDNNCLAGAGLYQPFPVFLVLMNPASATNGFECTVTPSGSATNFALSTTLAGTGALDVDASANGFAVGAAANYPVAAGGCTLVTWSYMLTGPGDLSFKIGPATVPSLSGGLPVVTGDGVLRRCGVASGSVLLPVATVNNANCVVANETSTFGNVKSLFR